MRGLLRVRNEVPCRTVWRITGSLTPLMVLSSPMLDSSTLLLRRAPCSVSSRVALKFMPTSR